MRRLTLLTPLALAVAVLGGCASPATLSPKVRMTTSLGEMVIQLDGEKAPRSCLNFVEYAKDGFYDGTIFHRVVPDYIILGGGYTADMDTRLKGIRPGIKNEWQNGLKHTRGSIAVSRLTGYVSSAMAQFFINVADNPKLNDPAVDGAGYAVFGHVVEGMDTLDRIAGTPVGPHPKYFSGRKPCVPTTPVVIESVALLEPFDAKAAQAIVVRQQREEDRLLETRVRTEAEKHRQLIASFVEEAGRDAVETASGLIYVDFEIGAGLVPNIEDKVELHYRATFPDGKEFDSSFDQESRVMALSSLLPGVAEGVSTMRVGGRRKLILPPELAFGAEGRPGVDGGPKIPSNATMIYEVKLLSIVE